MEGRILTRRSFLKRLGSAAVATAAAPAIAQLVELIPQPIAAPCFWRSTLHGAADRPITLKMLQDTIDKFSVGGDVDFFILPASLARQYRQLQGI